MLLMTGLVHIYTGNGKGKTTAAVGLGVRAYGRGLKVLLVQFLKGTVTGEINTLKLLEPDFMVYRNDEIKKFIWNMTPEEKEKAKKIQQDIFNYAKDSVMECKRDLVIMDEIMAAIKLKFIELQDVIDLIKNKPNNIELVLTGRDAPAELIELADYVSEIKAIKHPMEKGIKARIGIES
ncbi:MAG TPA: cob(I)yrinic acid a,c-diamide adenosyltransferase [Clostridiaceae bacterium]|nr:cob(I)yrinic acid a,c-diamide adenosyltransferase [Clostridiaceae bacterium]